MKFGYCSSLAFASLIKKTNCLDLTYFEKNLSTFKLLEDVFVKNHDFQQEANKRI